MRPRKVGIYQIEHVPSGRVYVGSSSNIAGRWRHHKSDLRRGIHKNQKLQNAWNKYGECQFRFSVLKEIDCESKLIQEEQALIDSLNSVEDGFNISKVAGRERAGIRHSEESIARMSAAHKGKTISPEHREKLRAFFQGREFSKEHRQRISDAKKGVKRAPFSDEARANMAAGQRGRTLSAETREKLSVANTGKVMSAQARERMSISQKKRLAQK